jgi:hypothetical protein
MRTPTLKLTAVLFAAAVFAACAAEPGNKAQSTINVLAAPHDARLLTGGRGCSAGGPLGDAAPLGLLLLGFALLGGSRMLSRPRRQSRSGTIKTPVALSGGVPAPPENAGAPRPTPTALRQSAPALPASGAATHRAPLLVPKEAPALPARPPARVRPAPAAPQMSLHDSPTVPVAITNAMHAVAAEDKDLTVIDTVATLRARMQMDEQKPEESARGS